MGQYIQIIDERNAMCWQGNLKHKKDIRINFEKRARFALNSVIKVNFAVQTYI